LGISPRTAEVYRGHIMSKTRAGSLAELVKMVLLVDGRAA
jgi:FixJ family two-component response regulator